MNARQMFARFANGGDVSSGLKYARENFGPDADKIFEQNIRNFFAKAPDEAATRAAMAEYGVSEADIKRATGRPLAEMFAPARQGLDAGALASELGIPTFQVANLLNQGLDASAIRSRYTIPVSVATDLMQRSMTGGVDTSEFDRLGGYERVKAVYDAAGGSYTPPFGQKPVTQPPAILPPTQPLPPLTEEFVAPTAPPPQAPPVALTPGQEGLDPSTAIVGATPVENRVARVTETAINKIPESERVTIPQLDTEFRASAPRTAIYDRFGRITGYNYSPAAKLTPATGTNVFNFVPPGITSRPRSLLNLGDVPGVTVDPVTGQLTMPLSASQRFARDRAELDNQFRRLYARAAEADTSLPTQAPGTAAAAFRNFAMSDPTMSAQLRMRDIAQTPTVNPTPAMTAARSEFGAAPYAAALTAAFDPFLARNKAALLASKDMQRSYFERYPDIATEYQKNWSKTMSPDEYAAYHYRTLGQKEGRTPPNLMGSPYTQQFFSKGGEASTEDFIKKQSGGDVSRETASPNTAEVPQLTSEGQLIDEREEIRSESQRMLNRLQSQPSKLPPGIRRTVAATREQGKESMLPAAAPARDLLSGILGASPTAPGSQAYRTGQAIANMPPVQAAAAIPAKIAASAGDAATALAAMGPAMGAVMKPKGGNWLVPSVERGMRTLMKDPNVETEIKWAREQLESLKDVPFNVTPIRQDLKEKIAGFEREDVLNKWINGKLGKYVKNELATSEDPIRALAERDILHVDPDTLIPSSPSGHIAYERYMAGFPEHGEAKSAAAKKWEAVSDNLMKSDTAENLMDPGQYGQRFVDKAIAKNPWLTKVDPLTKVYGVESLHYRADYNELGFDHLIDELRNAISPNNGLPRELQLDPKKLDRVSVPQAVELVDKINKWRIDNARKLRLEETFKADLYKAYPEQNYRWVQLNRPGQFAAESDAMGHSVRGYEPPDKGGSDYYGLGGFKAIQSGEAKVYSLRDEKGQPHVTIEVSAAPGAMSPSEFYHSDLATQSLFDRLDKVDEATINRDKPSWWEEVVRESPEYQEYLKTIPPKVTQIKGKGNGAPAEKYLPFIQDFVKSGNWSQVNDLQNTGLIRIDPASDLAAKFKSEGKPVPPYVSQDELTNLLKWHRGEGDLPEGFKNGGEVNVPRETSTSKQQLDKLAQVSQRKKA